MARIDWRIQGIDVTSCNCAWGCPCQFMSLPTRGNCHAAVGFTIVRGPFRQVQRLDGLSFGGLFAWPKAIHEGNGEAQPIVDVRANEAQRDAILKIMSGEETEPGATIFNVFSATYSEVHTPMFKPIVVDADLATRTGRIDVEGVVDVRLEPIRNPITGAVVSPADLASGRVRVGAGGSREQQRPHPHRADHARLARETRPHRAP